MTEKVLSKLKNQPYADIFACLLIILLAFVVYGQTLGFGLIDFDDPVYISRNPHYLQGFTYSNFVWSVTYFLNSNWAPLTIWSYIADASIYGSWFGGYHFTNVILHGLNGVLLFFIAFKLSNKYSLSLLLATLFIVHPQHVESVAWLSQRKDLLSAFFMFLSSLLYIFYKTKNLRSYYLLSIAAFMFGLMAKVIIAPLPVVLILIDYVFFSSKEKNLNFKYFITIIIEKTPYFVLALIFGGINYYAQISTGALGYSAAMPADILMFNIPVAYWFYPIKTLAPYNLIPFYPYPKEAPILLATLASVLLIVVTVLLYKYREKYKYLFFGWFCYLIIATPMSGIFQTGGHAYADRYSYLANIGLLIIVIAIFSKSSKYFSGKTIKVLVVAGVFTLTYLAHMQASLWRDTHTLFTHTLNVSENNMIALTSIAKVLDASNKTSESEKYYLQAMKTHPHIATVYISAARHYQNNHKTEMGIQLLKSALKLDIWQKGVIYRELAEFHVFKKDYENAIMYSNGAIESGDELAKAYYVRGKAYRMNNNYKQAITDLQMSISINRQLTIAYIEMGDALLDLGQEQEAIRFYLEALKQKPSNKFLEKRVSQLTGEL